MYDDISQPSYQNKAYDAVNPELLITILDGIFAIILVDAPTLDIKTCRKAFMMLMFMV